MELCRNGKTFHQFFKVPTFLDTVSELHRNIIVKSVHGCNEYCLFPSNVFSQRVEVKPIYLRQIKTDREINKKETH